MAGGLVNCSHCKKWFAPPREKSSDEFKVAGEAHRNRNAIREQAISFVYLSFALTAIALVALLVGLWNSVGPDATGGGYCWIIMWVCFGAALWVYTVAQIIHIRANTEK